MAKSQSTEYDDRSLSELKQESVVKCDTCGRPFFSKGAMKSHQRFCEEQ